MATPVEVSQVRTGAHGGIEGLGGIWRNRPWYMSERSVIAEVESGRYWTFFVRLDGENMPLSVVSVEGHKHRV
jgi:hypothetical protein